MAEVLYMVTGSDKIAHSCEQVIVKMLNYNDHKSVITFIMKENGQFIEMYPTRALGSDP